MKIRLLTLLPAILLAGVCATAQADSCRKNIFEGYDCTYDNGTTSTSRANIFGGQDTRH